MEDIDVVVTAHTIAYGRGNALTPVTSPTSFQSLPERISLPMSKITFDPEMLPSFAAVSTLHWPLDQQIQVAKAKTGIRSAEWFQSMCKGADEIDVEHLACALAFAAFAELRKRLPGLADRESLLQDAPGLRCPDQPADDSERV